jgi:hypothetical protein
VPQELLDVKRTFPDWHVSQALAEAHLVHPDVAGSSVVHLAQADVPSEKVPAAQASQVFLDVPTG